MGIEIKAFDELLKEYCTAHRKCYDAQENGPTRNLEDAQVQNKKLNDLGAALRAIVQPHLAPPDKKTYK